MTDITQKTVEEYLRSVSYTDDPSYVPSDFALEFITFIKLVNGAEGEENKSPVLHYKILDNVIDGNRTANMCHRGSAKALSLDTQVPTPKGNVSIADLAVGDTVFTRDGKQTVITHKSEIFNKPMYQITLVDGRKLKVSEDHLNIVLKRRTGKRSLPGFAEKVLTTSELLELGVSYTREKSYHNPTGKETKWYVPTAGLVEYPSVDSPIDPYTVGCILGDGSIAKDNGFTRFHTHIDDLPHFLNALEGADSNSVRSDLRRPSTQRFSLRGIGPKVKSFIGTESVYSKRVPAILLWGSSEQRLAVLRGLMDTDGTVYGTTTSFCSTSPGLINDVVWLVRSLGGEAKITDEGTYQRAYVYMEQCPFLLPRKVAKWKPNRKGMVGIDSIEPILDCPSQCIAVADESHSFLAESFFVTHNTTVLAEYLFLYLALYGELPGFGKIPLAIYVSDSIENGVKNMRKNIEYRWEKSDFLKTYVPTVKFTDVRLEFTNRDGTNFIVKMYGAQTGVRGAKEKGKRPTLAVLDDLVSDQDARSATVIASIEDTVYKAVTYALHPTKNKIIWSGTPFNAKDPLYKAVESGAWKVNVFPVCEEFPCSRADFKGSWPDRFTYDSVKAAYDTALLAGKIEGFNQEMMLRIMSDEDRLITDSDIQWYGRTALLKNKGKFNFYITTDFATSAKAAADFSVISVWALNHIGQWFWVDGICRKQTMDKNVDDLFRLVQMYRPYSVGVEISGQQGGFIPWINEQMMARNIYFTLASEGNKGQPGIRPNTDKMTRFNLVVPWFKTHQMHFPTELKRSPEMLQCMDELTNMSAKGTKSKHDDFSDTISMLAFMPVFKPSADTELTYNVETDIWGFEEEEIYDRRSSYTV